jgi:predicted amino acid dehydrogenase
LFIFQNNMQANIWRALVAICDWRTWKRILNGHNQVDVVFITNLRDNIDRQRYIGNQKSESGHFSGARINIKGVIGRTRFIDVDANELLTPAGRRKAKQQFIAAVQWAADRGAKVVLLAASTKRLFGRDGAEIMEMFPNIVFTIGDNGTAYLLTEEVFNALRSANLNQKTARIVVLGPYGILGQSVVHELVEDGYQVLGVGSNTGKLAELQKSHGIETATSLDGLKDIDIVVACTHSKEALLTAQAVQKIKRSDKKLIVIDVAEPSNFTLEEYQSCQDLVVRQDAGNAYSENLQFVLGGISYRMFRLTNGVIFGCFAEALSIGYQLKNGGNVQRNWFEVNPHNIKFTRKMFEDIEFVVPEPRCFEKMVTSFDL